MVQYKSMGRVLDCFHQPALAEPGATEVLDFSSKKNHGTMVAGKPDWVQLASILRVLDFNGTDAIIDYDERDSLKTASAFTFLIWVKSAETPSVQYIFANGDAGVNGWISYMASGVTVNVIAANGAASTSLNTSYTTGTWSLMAFTYADPDMSLSINAGTPATGVRAGPIGSYAGITAYQGFLPGKPPERHFDGQMSPPTLLSYAMTGAQITDFYTATRWWFGV